MVRVEFRVDGNLVNTDTTAPYAFTATGLAAGSHSVTATAVDNGSPALSTTSTAVAFSIGTTGNTAPTVSVTAPTNGQAFPAGTTSVNLAATATDSGGAVVRVEFRVDGTLVNSDTYVSLHLHGHGSRRGKSLRPPPLRSTTAARH